MSSLVPLALAAVVASPPPTLDLAQARARMAALTGLPPSAVIAYADGVAVAVVSPAAAARRVSSGPSQVSGVELRGEALDDGAAQALAWRSMRATVDLDCGRRRDRVRAMRVFAEPDLKGPARALALPGVWRAPDPKAFVGATMVALCGERPLQSGPPPGRETPKGASLAAEAAPSASGRKAYVAQIGAEGSDAAARRVLAGLARSETTGLRTRTERAVVGGRAVWRALIVGFPNLAAARALCARLRDRGAACLVR